MQTEERVYKILTKKKYNRDEPHLKEELQKKIRKFTSNNKPIKLVGFWGVGPKSKPNWAEAKSCKFLYNLNEEIKQVYNPGIDFLFIFATLHGIHNGIPEEKIRSYTKEMGKMLSEHGFRFMYLEHLWKKYKINFEKIDKVLKNKKPNWWLKVEMHKTIEKNAEKRSQKTDKIKAAKKYYIMRDLEKEIFEKEFPESIFHAFSDSKLREVLPNMPTIYFYARRGWSDTPWFVTEENKSR